MGPGPVDRVRDDTGGVWIRVTWVLAFVVYCGVLLAWHAGFSAALPFVVVPPLLAVMIAGGNLIGGRSRRPSPRFNRPDPVPVASRHDTRAPTAGGVDGAPAGGPGSDR